MTGDPLETAFERLDRAITGVEAEAAHRRALLDERERLYAEVARLSTDRAQLAQLLDQTQADMKALENANDAVSQQLMQAMETIRSVLAGEAAPTPAQQAGQFGPL